MDLPPDVQRVYDEILTRILRGDFPTGARMPSHESMAADLNKGITAVAAAYKVLIEDGYLVSGHMVCVKITIPERARALTAARSRAEELGDLEEVGFLTVVEVAGVMRVSKMTVYRMVHSGELTAVRVGRSFRVPAKAVREYLSGAYVDGQEP